MVSQGFKTIAVLEDVYMVSLTNTYFKYNSNVVKLHSFPNHLFLISNIISNYFYIIYFIEII